METNAKVKIKFYFKCTECGVKNQGDRKGEWTEYPLVCPFCDGKMAPGITRMPQKEK